MSRARILSTLAELREIKDVWERIHASGGGSLFQSFAWIEAWTSVVAERQHGDIRILYVENDAGCCILPLTIRRRMGFRRLCWLGMEVTDYCDLIGTDHAAPDFAAFVRANQPPADTLELRQLRTGSQAARMFGSSLAPGKAAEACPRIQVTMCPPYPKDILYAERRIATVGSLAYHVGQTPAGRAEIVEFVIAEKRAALIRQDRGTAEFDLLVSPFLRLLPGLSFPGQSRPYFSRLVLDGRTIAGQIGFIDGNSLLYYLPAFAFGDRTYSPGHLLILHLLRDAARMGLETIDLLRGQEPYKFKWAQVAEPLGAVDLALTLRGRIFVAARNARRRF